MTPMPGSIIFPSLASIVDQERQETEYVYLVSAGDIFSGNPMVDNFDPPGYPKIDLMNRVGYNLHTIGNHEFDYGIEMLKERMEQAGFPFILANLNSEGSGLPQPEPYHIIRAGKRSLGFIGLVQLNQMGIPSAHPDNMRGIEFFQPVGTAADYEFLAVKVDAVIGLTHHGFRSDTTMAALYPWFDVIIGGHSHTLTLEPQEHNGVLVTQAGSNMDYIGKVTLVFRGSELVEKRGEMISVSSITERNSELDSLVAEYAANPDLNRVIGSLRRPLVGKPELGCFITDAFREYGNLDFAFQNYGGIRIDSLTGDISISDIFRMDPFGNELVSMKVSYGELKNLIGNSLSGRGTPTVQISGGRIEVHLDGDGTLVEVKIIDDNDRELSHDGTYLAGMPSYIASAFDFEREDQGTGMGIITAQVIIDHITRLGEIDYRGGVRSSVLRGSEVAEQ
jgi:5'-nucleotidase / UDP-sugar diphosphatase